MTGYGKAMLETPQRKITVEIKSLNSKQADINTRLPWICKEKELDIRNLVIRKLERGKIDLSVSFDAMESEQVPVINRNNVKSYFSQLKEISGELGISDDAGLLAIVMRLPETLRQDPAAIAALPIPLPALPDAGGDGKPRRDRPAGRWPAKASRGIRPCGAHLLGARHRSG